MTENADIVRMGGLGAEMFKDCSPVQQRWLTAYAQCGDAERASQDSKIQHLEAMVWLQEDDDFKEAMDRARLVVGYQLEASAFQKATSDEGSDRLMIELLKAMMPEKYDDKYKGVQDEDEYEGSYATQIDVNPEVEDAV